MKRKFVIPVVLLALVWLGVMATFGVRGTQRTDPRAAAYHSAIGGMSQPKAKIYLISSIPVYSPHTIVSLKPVPQSQSPVPLLHGYEIFQEKTLTPDGFSEALERLTRRGTYGGSGAKCFMPGMAVQFIGGNGEEITAVICLKCYWVEWIQSGQRNSVPLSETGKNGLLALYKKHFPNAKTEGAE